jgi:hypothetical protein
MSKKASARKSTKAKAAIGNLKPRARREIGVRGGSTLRKRFDEAASGSLQKIG